MCLYRNPGRHGKPGPWFWEKYSGISFRGRGFSATSLINLQFTPPYGAHSYFGERSGRRRFRQAFEQIQSLGLEAAFLKASDRFSTGSVQVLTGPQREVTFRIQRPAAYDAIAISATDLGAIERRSPDWLYFGTLFSSSPEGRAILRQLAEAFPHATPFYDVNLRTGFDSPSLVLELLEQAQVVKMNLDEMRFLSRKFRFAGEGRSVLDRGGPALRMEGCGYHTGRAGLRSLRRQELHAGGWMPDRGRRYRGRRRRFRGGVSSRPSR